MDEIPYGFKNMDVDSEIDSEIDDLTDSFNKKANVTIAIEELFSVIKEEFEIADNLSKLTETFIKRSVDRLSRYNERIYLKMYEELYTTLIDFFEEDEINRKFQLLFNFDQLLIREIQDIYPEEDYSEYIVEYYG